MSGPLPPQPHPPQVEFVRVSKSFGAVQAVDAVSLSIERGEFFSLLGPSGCGKTTMLRMLAGLEQPDHDGGDIRVSGESVLGKPPYARRLGMVFQSYALFPHLSVARNVSYGLERRRVSPDALAGRVANALELVRLSAGEYAHRRPEQLSGGERQGVALARALVLEPELLLLDEPLGALDLKLRKAMQLELKQLNRTLGITFVYVTHDQDEALTMSDRIAVMERGRLQQVGSPRELYQRPRSVFVAGFLGESNLLESPGGGRVVIRPEQVELLPPGTPANGRTLHPGTVEDRIYLGERVRVIVALAGGLRVTASLPSAGAGAEPSPWSRGDAVLAGWRPEDAHPLDDS